MPAFAHRDEREEEVVLAVVRGLVATRADHVRERVDRERAVPEQARRHEEPRERPPTGVAETTTNQPHAEAERERRNEEPFVEPAELRILEEVLHLVLVGVFEFRREDPADVAPPETVDLRGVNVARLIALPVVQAVMRGPPDDALLRARRREEREHELHRARRLVRAVREVAVVPARHAEHAHVIERDRERETPPRPAEPHDARDGDRVHEEERKGSPRYAAVFLRENGLRSEVCHATNVAGRPSAFCQRLATRFTAGTAVHASP